MVKTIRLRRKQLTIREAAKLIGMSRSQLQQACRKGLIPAIKEPIEFGGPEAYAWVINKKDAIYYRNNRPKPGKKKKP